MKLGKLVFRGDDRGVSPVVGVVFVIGFVVLVGLGLFLFGQGLITGGEDPRVDTNFDFEAENVTHWNINYDTGDDFDSTNTDRLYIIGENSSEETIGEIMLYEDGRVTETRDDETPAGSLEEGMLALSSERAQEDSNVDIDPGSSLTFVWEPANQDGVQIVVDEIALPDEATIISQIEQDGEIDFGDGSGINLEGCDRGETC